MKKYLYKILKSCLLFLFIIPICIGFTACDSNSLSAYDIAVKNGFVGTEIEWLNSLKSKSAYDIAVQNGFFGTEEEWLESLKGDSSYEIAVKNGFKGTEEEWLLSLKDGKSAYDIAVEHGYKGTEEEWLLSLQGKNGTDGKNASTVDTYELFETAKENGEIDENCTYLEFIKSYFSTKPNYNSSIATKNLMSVVSIYSFATPNSSSSSCSGSGVIYSLDDEGNAYIITNYHVTYYTSIKMYPYYELYLYDQTTPIPATFVGASRTYDLAVLKVEANKTLLESNAQAVTLRDYDVMLGESCYAIGDTNKAGITLTEGVISVELEKIKINVGGISQYCQEIRHSAYIYRGNSGGGLFDANGQLIGINNGGVEQTLMNYAIPISFVKPICDNIINSSKLEIPKNKALVIETGIEKNLVATDVITIYDPETSTIQTKQTVIIDFIEENSLFDIEGSLKIGDEIVSITYNGTTFDNIKIHTLKTLLLSSKSGDVITISAKRTGENDTTQSITSTITLTDIFLKELI